MPLEELIPAFIRNLTEPTSEVGVKFDRQLVSAFNKFERDNGYQGKHTKDSLLKHFRAIVPGMIVKMANVPYLKGRRLTATPAFEIASHEGKASTSSSSSTSSSTSTKPRKPRSSRVARIEIQSDIGFSYPDEKTTVKKTRSKVTTIKE